MPPKNDSSLCRTIICKSFRAKKLEQYLKFFLGRSMSIIWRVVFGLLKPSSTTTTVPRRIACLDEIRLRRKLIVGLYRSLTLLWLYMKVNLPLSRSPSEPEKPRSLWRTRMILFLSLISILHLIRSEVSCSPFHGLIMLLKAILLILLKYDCHYRLTWWSRCFEGFKV
jgi:hypothetical protein